MTSDTLLNYSASGTIIKIAPAQSITLTEIA